MDKVLIRYIDNGSSRYDGKDFLESTRKIRRAEGTTGNIESGEQITIKTKARVWKAVVLNVNPEPPHKKRRKRKNVEEVALPSPELPLQGRSPIMASFSRGVI